MPRKPCNDTVEHRITLGEVERRELKKISAELDKLMESKKIANYGSLISWPVIALAGATGLGVAGWYLAQGLSNFSLGVGSLPKMEFGEVREDGTRISLSELVWGKADYTFNRPDGSTVTYNNMFGKNIWGIQVPFLGVLGGIAVNLGEASGIYETVEDLTTPDPQNGNGSSGGYNPTAETTGQGYTAAQYDAAYLCAKRYREGEIDFNEYLQCMEDAELMQGTR